MCRHELVELSDILPAIHARGVELYAISTEAPEEARAMVSEAAFTFPVLCDPTGAAIAALGLSHDTYNPTGHPIAKPTLLLIDRTGRILWSYRAPDVRARLGPDEILAALDGRR